MRITKSRRPPDSSLVNDYLPANYIDTFRCVVGGLEGISPDDIQVAFWTTPPGWVAFLFKVRDFLVKPLGLKSGKESIREFERAIRKGTDSGILTSERKSDHETVISLNDKHLKAYFSVYVERLSDEEQAVCFSTLVRFHNVLGPLYFYPILPFHGLVVKSLIKGALQKVRPASLHASPQT